jgi:hypothetical protein
VPAPCGMLESRRGDKQLQQQHGCQRLEGRSRIAHEPGSRCSDGDHEARHEQRRDEGDDLQVAERVEECHGSSRLS